MKRAFRKSSRRAVKQRKNLTLDPRVVVLAEDMQRQDMRPSLCNELEFLVVAEGQRRGLIDDKKALSILGGKEAKAA